MPYVFGKGSEARLDGLHPDLVKVLRRAIAISPIDFTIVEGLRSDEQCYINFGKGRSASQCTAAGCPAKYAAPADDKVTWLSKPLSSNHRKKADGYGHAVDIYPYPVSIVFKGKPKDYEPLFDKLAKTMFQAAKDVGATIRWGADWNLNNIPHERGESDNPHFELKS